MFCIWEKFRTAIHKDVSLKMIWGHLESMYDLMALVNIIKKIVLIYIIILMFDYIIPSLQ